MMELKHLDVVSMRFDERHHGGDAYGEVTEHDLYGNRLRPIQTLLQPLWLASHLDIPPEVGSVADNLPPATTYEHERQPVWEAKPVTVAKMPAGPVWNAWIEEEKDSHPQLMRNAPEQVLLHFCTTSRWPGEILFDAGRK